MNFNVPSLTPNGARVHIHLLGIGGCGVSGLARLLAQAGHCVSGSDAADSPRMAALRSAGVETRCGHVATVESRPDLVVYSTAIGSENPELVALRQAGVATIRRGEFLASLVNQREGIAVAGTHGKTTTTAMIAHILRCAGFSPCYCVGGEVPVLGEGNAMLGKGRWFVVEADESDGSLAAYESRLGIILNVEEEHLDYYRDLDAIVNVFEKFAANTRGRVFYCADDVVAAQIGKKQKQSISFGLGSAAHFSASDVQSEPCGSSFTVTHRGRALGRINLQIPGAHNISNALAAVAVAQETGVPFQCIADALQTFSGVRRRFEKKFESESLLVVDDYAHHPTEVRATIASARSLRRKRLVVAFQPHRYSRTKWLRHQFASAFALADRVFITDVYAANEAPLDGINGRTIYDAILATGQRDVAFTPSLEELANCLKNEAQPGDLILLMGAGNITCVADVLAEDFSRRQKLSSSSTGAEKMAVAA